MPRKPRKDRITLEALEPTYGRWTLVELASRKVGDEGGTRTRTHVRARCTCGTEKWIQVRNLTRGFTKSCGCIQKEERAARGRTRSPKGGNNSSPEYNLWAHIKYHRKQRGMDIPGFFETFPKFLKYLKKKPTPTARFNYLTLEWRTRSQAYEWAIEVPAGERAQAEAWLASQGEEVPPLLPYLLDRPTFVCYDEMAFGEPRKPYPVISQISSFDVPGCRRMGQELES